MNTKELLSTLDYIYNNNLKLQENGKVPITVNVEGEAGIGKTSSIKDFFSKKGLGFIKINLAQIEDKGDLLGFPIREFQLTDGNWVNEFNVNKNLDLNGKSRTNYCPPSWAEEASKHKEGGILFIDDWTRADGRIIQALMEFLVEQEYISFKLPNKWSIFLSSNPEDSEYSVTDLDPAQKTRFLKFKLNFDANTWGEWAFKNGINETLINFALMNKECFEYKMEKDKNNKLVNVKNSINPRLMTLFFNSINYIEDFSKHTELISKIASDSVGDYIGSMLINFINKKLDKIPNVENLLNDNTHRDAINDLENIINRDKEFDSALSSIINNRLLLYINGNPKMKFREDQIIRLLKSSLFTEDLKFRLVNEINNDSLKRLTINKEVNIYIK